MIGTITLHWDIFFLTNFFWYFFLNERGSQLLVIWRKIWQRESKKKETPERTTACAHIICPAMREAVRRGRYLWGLAAKPTCPPIPLYQASARGSDSQPRAPPTPLLYARRDVSEYLGGAQVWILAGARESRIPNHRSAMAKDTAWAHAAAARLILCVRPRSGLAFFLGRTLCACGGVKKCDCFVHYELHGRLWELRVRDYVSFLE